MFEDPSEGAEDKMSDALGCVLVGAALVVLLVIGVIIIIARAL